MRVYRREYVSIIAACGVGFPAVGGFLKLGFCRGVGGVRVRLGRMVVLLLMLLLLLLLWRFLLLFLLLLFPALPSLLFLANLHQLQPPLLMTDEHFMDKREEAQRGKEGGRESDRGRFKASKRKVIRSHRIRGPFGKTNR